MAIDPLTGDDARSMVIAEIQDMFESSPRRLVVGITGAPGVGKSTFAARLVDALNARRAQWATYVPMDGFHLANAQLDRLHKRNRKGAPDTFDVDGYVAALGRIANDYQSRDVYVPDFDRTLEEPVAAGRIVPAGSPIVVTEGNYLALPTHGWAPVRGLIDRLYYLETAAAVRRGRLIERHMAGGRSRDEAAQWVDIVDERNAALIAATESLCDRTLVIEEVAG